MSESELETLMKNISNFTKKIYSVPEFREWKKQITLKRLMYIDGFEGENNNLKDFKFSEKIENEYKLVDLFIKLHSCYISFCDCEYYFRRYPFRGLPIERDTHLKYICEMYFNRIYEFKEKMKNLFDEIHKFLAKKTNAGSIIKSYSHKFSIELTHRNLTNHHHGFDCLELSSLTLASIAARLPSNQGKGWDDEYNAIYRKESRTWASRVRKRSVDMLSYLEIIAKFMNENCKFLE